MWPWHIHKWTDCGASGFKVFISFWNWQRSRVVGPSKVAMLCCQTKSFSKMRCFLLFFALVASFSQQLCDVANCTVTRWLNRIRAHKHAHTLLCSLCFQHTNSPTNFPILIKTQKFTLKVLIWSVILQLSSSVCPVNCNHGAKTISYLNSD